MKQKINSALLEIKTLVPSTSLDETHGLRPTTGSVESHQQTEFAERLRPGQSCSLKVECLGVHGDIHVGIP